MAIPEGCKFIWQIHQDLYNTIKQQYEHAPLFKININGNIYNEGTETNSNTIKLQIIKGTNAAAYECKTVGIAVSCVIKYMSKIIAYCYLPLKCYTSLDDFDGSHIYSEAGGQGNVFRDITDKDGKIKGYIFTQQMAAGEYTTTDGDGHPSGWSGVVAGVIGDADSTGKVETGNFYGLRGYHQGTVSYELGTDDGHVTLGEVGKGRIEISPGAEAAIISETFNDDDNPGGLKISFANEPSIQYGNGNFKVNEYGILTAQGATIDGNFNTTYKNYVHSGEPVEDGEQKTVFKTGGQEGTTGAALGFLLETQKVTDVGNATVEVTSTSEIPGVPGYVIGNKQGSVQYVKSRIAPDSFSFGKYLGDVEEGKLTNKGLVEGIMYDFTNGLFISGTIRAKKGVIAGWTITDKSIVSPSGGLKLMSNGEIIGYSPVTENNEDEKESGQLYDFGDYLHIQRDNVAWETPILKGTTHEEYRWVQVRTDDWQQVKVRVSDPASMATNAIVNSSNGAVNVVGSNSVNLAAVPQVNPENPKPATAGAIQLVQKGVKIASGAMTVANANKESTTSTTETKETSDKGFITFVHNVLREGGQTFQNRQAIKKGDQYYKGSRPKGQTTGKCTPIVCSMEESVEWTEGNSNAESSVAAWNQREGARKTGLDTYSYEIVTPNGKEQISSIIGRAPTHVVFRKGATTEIDNELITAYTIIETYPNEMDTVTVNPDPNGTFNLEYKYGVDENDQVRYLICPNGVTTQFSYEEEQT